MSWLLLLNIVLMRSYYIVYVVIDGLFCILLMACTTSYTYSAMYRHLCSFQTKTIINAAGVNIILVNIYLHFFGVYT